MVANEIIQKLKEVTGNKNVKLPSSINFEIANKSLLIELSDRGICANMQTDKLHYERFLYRVWKFINTYEWAKNASNYNFTYYDEKMKNWVMNFPCNIAKADAQGKEAILEREFVERNREYYNAIDQQLPVGIFDTKKS